MIPSRVAESLPPGVRFLSADRVGGGCISPAARIETAAGPRFLKWSGDRHHARMFHAEAAALRAIAATNTVRVPAVEAVSDNWILMEWLQPGQPGKRAWSDVGAALARLHREQRDSFGWSDANFIGSLPQSNEWHESWPDFWRSERIEPQLARAIGAGYFTSSQQRALSAHLDRLDELLAVADEEGASLLHGDLWSGNAHAMATGIALIDPSTYYGHREVDLAMAALFGGFPPVFYEAYAAKWPLESGHEQRRAAYQLYYLLVHVNLFGAGYVPGVMESVSRSAT